MANKDNKNLMILGAGLFLFFISNSAKAGTPPTPGTNIPPHPGGGYIGPEGSLQESYLGIAPTAQNRGIRNNNPGNVKFARQGGNPWRGKIPEAQNSEQRITDPNHSRYGQPIFEQFEAWPFGVRVMIFLIKKYITDHQANTIDKIIVRWADGGNENYKNYLATRTGKSRTETISATDETTIKNIVQSIANFENGQAGTNDLEVITDLQYTTARNILA